MKLFVLSSKTVEDPPKGVKTIHITTTNMDQVVNLAIKAEPGSKWYVSSTGKYAVVETFCRRNLTVSKIIEEKGIELILGDPPDYNETKSSTPERDNEHTSEDTRREDMVNMVQEIAREAGLLSEQPVSRKRTKRASKARRDRPSGDI